VDLVDGVDLVGKLECSWLLAGSTPSTTSTESTLFTVRAATHSTPPESVSSSG
jgi:hypothetical protein